MSTAIHVIPEPLPTTSETRFAAYLLADYLERLGVEVVFGLTGHTVIGDARRARPQPHPLRQHAARAGRGARGRRLRPGDRQAGRPAHPSRPGPDQRRDRRRQRRARFDPDGGDRRRRAVVLPRPPSAPGDQPAPGRRPVPDLPAVLQARLPRRAARAICRAIIERAFHLAQAGRPGPVLVDVPMDVFSTSLPVDAFNKVPAEIARPSIDDATARADRRRAGRRPSVRCSTPAAACSRRARRRSWPRSPRRSSCRSRTR